MKKWIPLAAIALLAIACSKTDDDREVLNNEPIPIVTDTSNDIPVAEEIRGGLD